MRDHTAELEAAGLGDEAALAAARLGDGAAIAFDVDGDRFTYRVRDGRLHEGPGDDGDAATLVACATVAWQDFHDQVRTFINLQLAGELTFVRGRFDALADWDPALKLLHAGIPLYDPARVDLSDLDVATSFPTTTDDAELAAFLSRVGYLHVTDVFTGDEVAELNAAVDELVADAREGDDTSWWVETEDGQQALCRLVYVTERSPRLWALLDDARLARLSSLLHDGRVCTDRMEGVAVLIKVPGRTRGLANIPWHQDCGMGGHAFMCPATMIGIQLTGSSPETGNFVAVPGSHGQTLHYQWEQQLEDVPTVAIDTAPGDVTVHIPDLMHASPRPTGAGGRRTLYLTWYPPELWDHIGPDEALNDLVRNRQADAEHLKG